MLVTCWVLVCLLILGKLLGLITVGWGFVVLVMFFPTIWTIFWLGVGVLILKAFMR